MDTRERIKDVILGLSKCSVSKLFFQLQIIRVVLTSYCRFQLHVINFTGLYEWFINQTMKRACLFYCHGDVLNECSEEVLYSLVAIETHDFLMPCPGLVIFP